MHTWYKIQKNTRIIRLRVISCELDFGIRALRYSMAFSKVGIYASNMKNIIMVPIILQTKIHCKIHVFAGTFGSC